MIRKPIPGKIHPPAHRKSNMMLCVNGARHDLSDISETTSLVWVLRNRLGLTGTKISCGQGACGSCTVSISRDGKKFAVNACITPIGTLQGWSITTVEGLGTTKSPHAIQKSIAEHHGVQCGFCTPGMVMAAYSSAPNPPRLDGNLCRCTGYRPIIEATKASVVDVEDLFARPPATTNGHSSKTRWQSPENLAELKASIGKFPEGQLVGGCTEGVGGDNVIISLTSVAEMKSIVKKDEHLEIGAAVTVSELLLIEEEDDGAVVSIKALKDACRWFASEQIRNVATIGGNVAFGSEKNDLRPLLIALRAALVLLDGSRCSIEDYRKGIIVTVCIPLIAKNSTEFVSFFKQGKRRASSRSVANAGMRLRFDKDGKVDECSLVFGNRCALDAAKALIGQTRPLEAPHLHVDGDHPPYVRTLQASFLHKFILEINGSDNCCVDDKLSEEYKSHQEWPDDSGAPLCPSVSLSPTRRDRTPVGQPVPAISALACATGEAKFVDDISVPLNCLHAALVYTTVPHGEIVSIDGTPATQMPGVRGFFCAQDVVGSNRIGAVLKDEECFVSRMATAVGQALGIVVADSREIAKRAAAAVKVEYEQLPGIFTIDEAIKHESYFLRPGHHSIVSGDAFEDIVSKEDVVVASGDVYVGGQEHFYMETNSSLCVPMEEGGMTVFASTQNPTSTQMTISSVLGVSANKVVCRVKRLGGGFGGKECRTVAYSAAAAIAADKMQKPVKLVLDRGEDMRSTGSRHPMKGEYKVAADKNGRIRAVHLDVYANAGYSLDLSGPVVDRAIFTAINAYTVPHFNATAYLCKTNTSSNTAFRGFGGPQGMFICETYMDHVARVLDMPPHQVRAANLSKPGDVAPCGQLNQIDVDRLWKRCVEDSEFDARLAQVEKFNEERHVLRRGISLIPVLFGVSFTARFYEQGGALVHAYTDGSVLVTHGGTEMGQGLHTKVQQVVARALCIPVGDVHVEETATDKVANTPPTAASMATELVAMAALDACNQLVERLKPLKKKEDEPFSVLVRRAFYARVDTSAHGYYKVKTTCEDYDFDKVLGPGETNADRGCPYNFYTCGVACTEVQVDTMTGHSKVVRADLVMDLGAPINPGIDIGQIEGAYVQGYGMYMLEELKHENGHLMTDSPTSYKIPSADDAPLDFRVTLVEQEKEEEPFFCHSSRAVGEPPVFLGAGAFFATLHAIDSVRDARDRVPIDSPLTPERVRMVCGDEFAKRYLAGGEYTRPVPTF